MSAPKVLLKDQLFNRVKVAMLAGELASVHAEFHADEFVDVVAARLPDLGLTERIAWIAACLARHLPGDYRQAVGVILSSLPAPNDPTLSDGDFGDFIYAPYTEYVAQHGCTSEDLVLSLAALRELTMRFSAEDAIRTFINTFPDETLRTLLDWAGDKHYHVRRLCSEATRPRLPWSRQLGIAATAAMPILDTLFSDPTRYVTRSVANHINDIAKADPDLAIDTLARWRQSGRQDPNEMGFIVRHGTRSLVKDGHPQAMELLGVTFQPPARHPQHQGATSGRTRHGTRVLLRRSRTRRQPRHRRLRHSLPGQGGQAERPEGLQAQTALALKRRAGHALQETPPPERPDNPTDLPRQARARDPDQRGLVRQPAIPDPLIAPCGGNETMRFYDMQVEHLGTLHVPEHFTVADGKITRLRQIHDTAPIRAMMSSPPAAQA